MLNILTTVALTIERLVVIHKSDGDDTTDFTFAWLLLVNAGASRVRENANTITSTRNISRFSCGNFASDTCGRVKIRPSLFQDETARSISVAGFCVFHVFYGMIREQKYEIYVYLAAMAIVVIYCIVQYAVDADGRTTPMLVSLGQVLRSSEKR